MGLHKIIRLGGPLLVAALGITLTACGGNTPSSASHGSSQPAVVMQSHKPAAPVSHQPAAPAPAAQAVVPAGYAAVNSGKSGEPAIGAKCIERTSEDGLSPKYDLVFVNSSGTGVGVYDVGVKFSTGYRFDDTLTSAYFSHLGQLTTGPFRLESNGQPFTLNDSDMSYSLDAPSGTGLPGSCQVTGYNLGA